MAAKRQSDQPFRTPVSYEDVAVTFTQDEWEYLTSTQRNLYQKVMSETFKNLTFVGSKNKPQEPTPGPEHKDGDADKPSSCTGVFKGGPFFFCLTCGKCFKKNTFLFSHQFPVRSRRLAVTNSQSRYKSQHRGERLFSCNLCGKTYRDASGLSRHRRAHLGYRPRSCPECGKCFRDQSEVNRHLKVHQNKPGPSNQKWKSRVPPTTRSQAAALKYVKVIQGPVARAKARNSGASSLNVRSNSVPAIRSREKISCPYCHITFTLRTCLLSHLKIHFRRQPNQHVCCREAHSSNTLRMQKIYNCPVCDSSFRGKESLLDHLCCRRPIRFSKCWEILGYLLGYLHEPVAQGNIFKVRESSGRRMESRKRRRKCAYRENPEREDLSEDDDEADQWAMEVSTDDDLMSLNPETSGTEEED
ncbi:zinc finger protein 57 homolog [Mastomys coucha]|uniref:zinc finger protein 57 homolog n=1 Tax=Mastomys coucha TaxID=35658 RepID=UPI00126149A3|nr:zinc finger protein 57 homolog [Mastomys coucha]XP_031203175.1 zinc finger protein 57 homolog [Mastomys coucha]XP_031203176.1 zinc finger protein 57 homolog [Mastomys coucha]XP_031203177.1 zinc finger protein 57 homolog [Mastomys coucha]XP_031203178.1 zinc finger protein 57 homolog [Mastomys coucha]